MMANDGAFSAIIHPTATSSVMSSHIFLSVANRV